MNNRLQFRHHTPIFDSREEAIDYIYQNIKNAREGLAYEDDSYGYSLFAEPTILRYKNEADDELPSGSTPNPHLILAIGSNTNEGRFHSDNRFCIIDIDKTEKEIEDLWEYVEEVAKGLNIITRDTNTLKLYSAKTDEGNVVSGDVVVAESQIFDDIRRANTLLNTEDGLFTFVKLEYEPGDDKFTFFVNGDKKIVPLYDYYIIKGYYSKKDESLHLIRKDGVDIKVSLENLIDEWGVEGEATNTPIVLTKEEVGYGDDALHNHVEPYQDLLKADVRLSDRKYNILKKTSDGRYLYVDGLASNIVYFKDGEEISVQDALRQATKGISNDSTNIIYEKADGCYATAQLRYINKENKLIFTTSNVTGGTSVEEIKLNAVEAFTKIYYDSVTETLVIMYKDGSGDIQEVDVPIGQMMQDWEWDIQNEGHNVKLHKQRVVAGNDKVSADAAIYNDPDNILVDKNHELFVKGTADNIRYGRGGNVSDELDKLNANDADINARLNETSGKVDTLRVEFDAEVERATSEEQRIEDNLGLLSAKTEAEIVRAKSEEQRIEKKFDDALGEGFDIRNTVRDEFDREKSERIGEDARLQAEIDALSADTKGKLIDVINLDHSIDVDKTDLVKPVISVNLSDEQIENMPNVIKLNNDGLYAGVDLDYYFESGTSKNVLVFKTTNGTKTFDLKTNSVVDKIYYDPTREAIIIEYTVDGHRMPDVVVPVGDLIDEWRPSESTNGAIKLTKSRESGATQDVLYAESIISNHEDNILVNDNGALYVSNVQIEQNKADIAALSDRMDSAEADIDALEGGLAAEIARATDEESRIEGKLDREIERSTAEDSNIWEALRAEISRSTAKDDEHDTNIANEIQRATNAENMLHGEIVDETNARTSADTAINTKIDNEITRATNKEGRIEDKLDAEISRSTTKDTEHETSINGLRTDLTNEIANRTNADNDLRTAIHEEEDRAKGVESAITHNLEVETIARTNGEATLNQKIDTEVTNRTNADTLLQTNLDNEATARIEKDNRIEVKLDAEISRSTTKDNELQLQITTEATTARAAESSLRESVTTEAANRTAADANLQTQITNEVTRAQGAENLLDSKIDAEKEARETEDARIWNKIRPIEFEETDTVRTARVRNEGEIPDIITHNVKLASGINNLIKVSGDGLTAEVTLDYDVATNEIILKGTDGSEMSREKLGPGSILDNIYYDYAEKDLVIEYHSADGISHKLNFPVADLFNEWDIKSVEEKAALKLYKETQSGGTGNVDLLWGRVLITDDHDGDGKPDQGSDNIIEIRSNGLYASGSAMTEAKETAECVKNELKVVENAVLGEALSDIYICGSGYTYTPYERACFINNATSMYDADKILDEYVCSAHTRITNVEEDVDCLWNELNITQENVIGVTIPKCGIKGDGTPYKYEPNPSACFINNATSIINALDILDSKLCDIGGSSECADVEIKRVESVLGVQGNCEAIIEYPKTQGCLLSNATSFAEADAIMEAAICNLQGDFIGLETPTASVGIVKEGINNRIKADVRLSHGNDEGKWQTDEDLTIYNSTGDEIEPNHYEFTDTNVLRIVANPQMVPESEYNGLYLSNEWNCGQYTENGEGTPYEKYKIDDSATAMNYYTRKYRNGVRYRNGN